MLTQHTNNLSNCKHTFLNVLQTKKSQSELKLKESSVPTRDKLSANVLPLTARQPPNCHQTHTHSPQIIKQSQNWIINEAQIRMNHTQTTNSLLQLSALSLNQIIILHELIKCINWSVLCQASLLKNYSMWDVIYKQTDGCTNALKVKMYKYKNW